MRALMVFMAATATLSPVATSCKSTSFKGSSEIGPRTAGSAPGLPGAPGSSGTPNPGTPENPFSNPGGNPGTSSDLPHAVIPTAPLQIAYDSHEADDNSRWTGTYVYSIQRGGGGAPVQILAYNSGATGTATVAGICQCGARNDINLIITAGGLTQNLTAWRQEAIAAHAKPTNAPDLLKFINKYQQFPQAAYTVYFAGFDHIFLGNQWCATSPFACDSRNWDNRDDNGVVFSCKVADCPNGGPGTELHFAGEDN